MKVISIRPTNGKPLRQRRNRRGSLIVWCSLLLVVLLGMLGLVVDGGLLMATYRHAQNAADAAALSVANDRLWGYPGVIAKIRATGLVTHPQNNNLPSATVTIHTPPITGPYAGQQRFAEVIVTSPNPTYFIHVLPGVGSTVSVTARAVAGFERVPAAEAILTTNPDARPGVYLPDNAKLSVVGTLHVNSEGGGVDEYGDLANQNDGLAIDLGVGALVRATGVYAVGGVNDPARYEDTEDETSNPLDANAHPAVDPFRFMPTPIVGIGVADVERGEPMASSDDLALNNPDDFSANPNFIENPGQPNQTMVLHPGIYRSIRITGGRVRFQPGIYVLKPTPNHGDTDMLVITGGTVIAQGVMFYNTGSNYQPISGSPDVFDDEATPPALGQRRLRWYHDRCRFGIQRNRHLDVCLRPSRRRGIRRDARLSTPLEPQAPQTGRK